MLLPLHLLPVLHGSNDNRILSSGQKSGGRRFRRSWMWLREGFGRRRLRGLVCCWLQVGKGKKGENVSSSVVWGFYFFFPNFTCAPLLFFRVVRGGWQRPFLIEVWK